MHDEASDREEVFMAVEMGEVTPHWKEGSLVLELEGIAESKGLVLGGMRVREDHAGVLLGLMVEQEVLEQVPKVVVNGKLQKVQLPMHIKYSFNKGTIIL